MDELHTHTGTVRVIGVGASAGGLEALQALLEPARKQLDAAVVVIQHLAPDHASMTADLLNRHTELEVRKVTEQTELEAGVVFVIEPKTVLTLDGDTLLVRPRTDPLKAPRPIDRFFASLAGQRGPDAYAVILSGTGSDGTDGARAIKEAGGFVVAQSPDTARFDGMPRSVINARCHDLCLPPDEILGRIEQVTSAAVAELQASPGTLDTVLQVLVEHEDVDLTSYRQPTVRRRVERRLAIAGVDSVDAYVSLLRSSPGERTALVADLFIGVTRFFRDPDAYATMRRTLETVPEAKEPFRCWVCGCSTGEEAYSVAMLLWEVFRDSPNKRDFKIFATDISEAAIGQAGRGLYNQDVMRDVPPEKLARFFRRNDDGEYTAETELRNRIVFSHHDALRDPPFSRLNLVVCRNMLIYLQPDAQRNLLGNFSFSLVQDGLMWLGPSESGAEKSREFVCLDTRWRIFTNRVPLRGPRLDWKMRAPYTPVVKPPRDVGSPVSRRGDLDWMRLHDEISRTYLPSHVIINSQYRVLFQHGTLIRGLIRFPEGESTTDLRLLLPEALRPALESIVSKAQQGEETELRGLTGDGLDIALNVHARPVSGGDGLVVLFVSPGGDEPESALPKKGVSVLNLGDIEADLQHRLEYLEHEIQLSRESLQNTVEELESSNEELQATNEELLASNEELQSVNEELQSVNEELHTVNTEHQEKIVELAELNGDLDTLLATVDHGVLFLDGELNVRRFNPKVQDFVSLREADIGRPFGHFSHSLKGFGFLDAAARCLRDEDSFEEVVELVDGAGVALVRFRPLGRPSEKAGIVISITDITNVERLRETNSAIRAALDTVTLPLGMLNRHGQFDYANSALTNLSQRDPRYIEGTNAGDLVHPEFASTWNEAQQQALKGGTWEGYVQLALPDQSTLGELVRLSPIISSNGEVRGMARLTLMCSDVDAAGTAAPTAGFLLSGRGVSERHILGLFVRDLRAPGPARERALRAVFEQERPLLVTILHRFDDAVSHDEQITKGSQLDFGVRLPDGQDYRIEVMMDTKGAEVEVRLLGYRWLAQGNQDHAS